MLSEKYSSGCLELCNNQSRTHLWKSSWLPHIIELKILLCVFNEYNEVKQSSSDNLWFVLRCPGWHLLFCGRYDGRLSASVFVRTVSYCRWFWGVQAFPSLHAGKIKRPYLHNKCTNLEFAQLHLRSIRKSLLKHFLSLSISLLLSKSSFWNVSPILAVNHNLVIRKWIGCSA